MRVDFHSHILPQMDDGASSVAESSEMLMTLKKEAADVVVLTPHFYRQDENIEQFIIRRSNAFEQLAENVSEKSIPKLVLGAEVYFYPSLSSDINFSKLCIEGTNYVLVELPFEHFSDSFYRDFSKFMNHCKVKVILAHIERYLQFENTEKEILKLFDYGDFVCQMNCTSIAAAGFFQRRTYAKLISSGIVGLIGTDAHNMSKRPPMFNKAENAIIKCCGEEEFNLICENSEKILKDYPLTEIN